MKEQNPELVGWITIPNIAIDYPVMQAKEDNDYYLTHDFHGNKDSHGTPFLDMNCKLGESENLIIYGHHMKDGTMFQNLKLYEDASFCEENPAIYFDTPDNSSTYEVRFVMILSGRETEDFPYHSCTRLNSEEAYEEFIAKCRQYSIWCSEDIPDFRDELLTLSTCEYSKQNGRLILVAQKLYSSLAGD